MDGQASGHREMAPKPAHHPSQSIRENVADNTIQNYWVERVLHTMTRVTKTSAVAFAFLEFLAAYAAFFDRRNDQMENRMTPATFRAYNEGTEATRRLVDFYVVWMGANKALMTVLVLVCSFSRDARTRLLCCISVVVGVSGYFVQQAELYKQMDLKQELVQAGVSEEISLVISAVIIPTWIFASIWELKSFFRDREEPIRQKSA